MNIIIQVRIYVLAFYEEQSFIILVSLKTKILQHVQQHNLSKLFVAFGKNFVILLILPVESLIMFLKQINNFHHDGT